MANNTDLLTDKVISFYSSLFKNKLDCVLSKNRSYLVSNQFKESISLLLAKQLSLLCEQIILSQVKNYVMEENPFYFIGEIDIKSDFFKKHLYRVYEDINALGIAYFDNISPRISELLNNKIDSFLLYLNEVLDNIDKDKNNVSSILFNNKTITKLLDVECENRFSYDDCRTVYIISCDIGKFVYKPRDSKTEKIFKDISKKYFNNCFYVPNVLNISNHSYCEFINNNPVKDKNSTKEYYYNMGVLCLAMVVFRGYDIHSSNILARNTIPVLIDLESIFRPHVDIFNEYNLSFLDNSAIQTFILPTHVRTTGIRDNNNPLTDTSDANAAMPCVDGVKQNIYDYCEYFIDGFKKAYNDILSRKDELIKDLTSMDSLFIRILIRNFGIYHGDICRFLSIDNLSSNEKRKELINKLISVFSDNYRSENIARCEIESISNGTIPYFYSYSNSKDLYYKNRIAEKNFMKITPLDNCINRINAMSVAERDFEIDLIKGTLTNEIIIIPPIYDEISSSDKEKLFSLIEKYVIKVPNGKYVWSNIYDNDRMGDVLAISKNSKEIANFCKRYADETENLSEKNLALDFALNSLNTDLFI